MHVMKARRFISWGTRLGLLCVATMSSSIAQARFKSRWEPPMTTLLKEVADGSRKAIISSLSASETVPEGDFKAEAKFKTLLDEKGLAWVEHDEIVRIVRKESAADALKSLQEDAADPWCKTMTTGEVNNDFPEPTDIKDITKAMALWSGTSIIVPKYVEGKVRIAHDRKISLQRACRLWLAALAQTGFRASHSDKLMVLLPEAKRNDWQWPAAGQAKTANQDVEFDFSELTDAAKIVARYNEATSQQIKMSPDAHGQIRFYAAGKIPADKLSLVFQAILQSAGLKADHGVVRSL